MRSCYRGVIFKYNNRTKIFPDYLLCRFVSCFVVYFYSKNEFLSYRHIELSFYGFIL